LTADVDVTVDAGSHSNTTLVSRLASEGFELRVPDAAGFVEQTRVLPLVHAGTRIPVDVVLAGPGLEDLFFSRAEKHVIAGVQVPVAAAEDIVTMKILAGRPRDLDDVAAIVRARPLARDRVQSTLSRLEQALDRRDLVPEFERLLRQAGRVRGQDQ
jgi:hypothetical protein